MTAPSGNGVLTYFFPAAAAAAAGGHYTAHVQQGDGRWLHFNDAAVDFVPQGKVLEQKPYLLVYQRA